MAATIPIVKPAISPANADEWATLIETYNYVLTRRSSEL